MKLTRRAAAKMFGVSATGLAVQPTQAQPPQPPQPSADAVLGNARNQVQQNARDLGAVKLPRSMEPATRFEV